MPTKSKVTKAYAAMYPDPIQFSPGDPITLTGRTDNWQGHIWLWAINETDGRKGWIPDSIVSQSKDGETIANADYSAVELSCEIGDVLSITHATHGWCWCIQQDGSAGWVPLENLQTIKAD